MKADKDSLKHFLSKTIEDDPALLYVIPCFFASHQHSIDYLT